MFSKVLAASALASVALAGYSNSTSVPGNSTVVTTDVVVTEFTTYCPESTTVTFTTCPEKDVCGEHVVTVTEPTTLTVTSCEVPTTYTTTVSSTTVETVCPTCTKKTTVAPTTVVSSSSMTSNHTVTTAVGGAQKVAAGAFAGVAAVAAALF